MKDLEVRISDFFEPNSAENYLASFKMNPTLQLFKKSDRFFYNK